MKKKPNVTDIKKIRQQFFYCVDRNCVHAFSSAIMSIVWKENELNEFWEFLDAVKRGEITDPAYVLPPEEKLNNPKSFDEIAKKASELPSDDPITWAKLSKCGEYYICICICICISLLSTDLFGLIET